MSYFPSVLTNDDNFCRLRSEDRRQETELLLEKQNRKIAEHERKIEDLGKAASQVERLEDQLEEYKHTNEKLHKMENAIEKYKKRLEDSADLRRQIKVRTFAYHFQETAYRPLTLFVTRLLKNKMRHLWKGIIRSKMNIEKFWRSRPLWTLTRSKYII